MSNALSKTAGAPGQTRLLVHRLDYRGHVVLMPVNGGPRGFQAAAMRIPQAAPQPAPQTAEPAAHGNELTPREQEIMNLLIEGMSNKMVAYDLSISPRTVEIHRARIMRKMGVRNVAALVRAVLTAA